MAFARLCQARLPVVPLRVSSYDAADFALCCGLVGCTFLKEGSTPRFDARISPYAGGLLQRDLAPPPAGLTPASLREPQDAPQSGDSVPQTHTSAHLN